MKPNPKATNINIRLSPRVRPAGKNFMAYAQYRNTVKTPIPTIILGMKSVTLLKSGFSSDKVKSL
jgi:hypothetical protein